MKAMPRRNVTAEEIWMALRALQQQHDAFVVVELVRGFRDVD